MHDIVSCACAEVIVVVWAVRSYEASEAVHRQENVKLERLTLRSRNVEAEVASKKCCAKTNVQS